MAVTLECEELAKLSNVTLSLNSPVVVKGSAGRCKLKINFSDEYSKKERKWIKAAEQVKAIVNHVYAIVYLHFRKDVE